MIKESITLLCASFCLSFGLPTVAQAAAPTIERLTAEKRLSASDSINRSKLLADKENIRKKLQMEKKRKELELKESLEQEGLEYPAIDLYGEDAWNDSTKPIVSAKIPDRYLIDLSDFAMPLDRNVVSSSYGYRRRFKRMHYGTDLPLTTGDTIRAAFSGKVRVVNYNRGGYGKYIIIRHPNGLETLYGHLSKHLIKNGDIVRAGEVIGLGGNTGRSTGPHLHFETRFMGIPLNPERLIDFAKGQPKLDSYLFTKAGAGTTAYRSAKYASSSTKNNKVKTVRVSKGQTLASVAKKYGVSASQLAKINGLKKTTRFSRNTSIRIR